MKPNNVSKYLSNLHCKESDLKDESKILVIFAYLLSLMLEESFNPIFLLILNIFKSVYILLAFKSQFQQYWVIYLEIMFILSVSYYSNKSKSDSLILLLLFSSICTSKDEKPRMRRLYVFIVHCVCFSILLSIINCIYYNGYSSFISLGILSTFFEGKIILFFYYSTDNEKEVFKNINEANIGFLIIKKIKGKSSEELKLFYSNNMANDILTREVNQEAKTTRSSLINQINEDILSDERVIDRIYHSNEEKFSVNSITSAKTTMLTIESTVFERHKIKEKMFRDMKLQILISFLHNLNNPINGLITDAQNCLDLTSKEKKKSIIDNIKYNRFHIKLFNRNISFYSSLLLNEVIHLNPCTFNLKKMIKKLIKKYECFYHVKQIQFDHDINISSNSTVHFDIDKFKYLLSNIFMFIVKKREYDRISFKAEYTNHSKSKVRLMFNMNEKLAIIREQNEMEYKIDDFYRIENNAQAMEMVSELIITLADLLGISLKIHKESVMLEIDCICNGDDENDWNMVEFSPNTDNQNNIKRIQIINSLSYFCIHPLLGTKQDSKGSVVRGLDDTTEKSPQNYVNNDEGKSIFLNQIEEPSLNKDSLKKANDVIGNEKTWQLLIKQNKTKSNFNERSEIEQEISMKSNKNNIISFTDRFNNYKRTESIELKKSSSFHSETSCNCKQILIVDDEPFVLNAVKSVIFKEFKIESDECANGIEAINNIKHDLIKKCCTVKYKLLFVDINMPLMGGFSLCNEIQKLFPECYDLSIIIISSYSNLSDIQSVLKKNKFVKDFSEKPLRKSAIKKFVNQYIINNEDN